MLHPGTPATSTTNLLLPEIAVRLLHTQMSPPFVSLAPNSNLGRPKLKNKSSFLGHQLQHFRLDPVLHSPAVKEVLQIVNDRLGNLAANMQSASGNVRGDHCPRDRKSTRLNSSHLVISYAVFC